MLWRWEKHGQVDDDEDDDDLKNHDDRKDRVKQEGDGDNCIQVDDDGEDTTNEKEPRKQQNTSNPQMQPFEENHQLPSVNLTFFLSQLCHTITEKIKDRWIYTNNRKFKLYRYLQLLVISPNRNLAKGNL